MYIENKEKSLGSSGKGARYLWGLRAQRVKLEKSGMLTKLITQRLSETVSDRSMIFASAPKLPQKAGKKQVMAVRTKTNLAEQVNTDKSSNESSTLIIYNVH